jgi:hypothetical protein
MSVILATQEAEIRRIAVQSQPGQIVHVTLSQNILHKIGLVEWVKVKALSSNPSTTKKKKLSIPYLKGLGPEVFRFIHSVLDYTGV